MRCGSKNFTEIKQAKWDLRRMLGDLGHDLPSSLFLLCEFTYPKGRNTKGLLRIKGDADFQIDDAKPAYFACRNVTAIFDNSLERVVQADLAPQLNGGEAPTAQYRYRNRETGKELVVFWKRVTCSDEHPVSSSNVEVPKASIDSGVLVDLLSGAVWKIPASGISTTADGQVFSGIPLTDSPIIISDETLIPVK